MRQELWVSLTLVPFTATEDSTGRNSREAGWPLSGGVAWTMTRRSWVPTMPQLWATVIAVCRLSPGGHGATSGSSCYPGETILTLTLIKWELMPDGICLP